jgi:hypothetical protein
MSSGKSRREWQMMQLDGILHMRVYHMSKLLS